MGGSQGECQMAGAARDIRGHNDHHVLPCCTGKFEAGT